MINKEIERKFVVCAKDLPELSHMTFFDINQGYICDINEEYVFRLRQAIMMTSKKQMLGKFYYQTIKGAGTREREEYEHQIPSEIFHTFWPACNNISLHKWRYELPIPEGRKDIQNIHLDIYKNGLEGNFSVEVEFFNRKDCDKFKPFEWFGKEVTEDDNYKNVNVAIFGWPDCCDKTCDCHTTK